MSEGARGSTLFTQGSEPFYGQFCQPCSKDKRHLEVQGFCQDCQEYLCQDCYDKHRTSRPTHHHYLLNKDEMPTTSSPSVVRSAPDVCSKSCEKHPKKIIKYHCPKHDDVVCGVCVTLSHITCGVTYIPDLANGIGDSSEYTEINQALLNYAKKVHGTIDLAKKNLTNVQQSYEDAMKDAQQIRKEINEMMDLLESRIRTEANVFKSADNKRMNAIIGKCDSLLQEAKALQIQLKSMKDQKQEYNLFLGMKQGKEDLQILKDKINNLQENNQVTHYVFDRSDDLWDFVNNTSAYGKLVRKEQSKQACHVTDMSIKPAKAWDRNAPIVTGMVLLNEDTLVAVDYENINMYVYDIQTYAKKLDAMLSAHPWDVAKIGKESVAVTFPYLQKVVCYTVKDDSKDPKEERAFSTNGFCNGIDYQRDCFYVTLCSNNSAHVEILNSTGKTLMKINNLGNEAFVRLGYISVLSDSLIVSDVEAGTVIKIQKDGKLEWIYRDLMSPLGLAVGRNGSVIVCTQDADIVRTVSSDGKHGKVLLSLRGPQAVAFCKTSGRLFVSQDPSSDILKVYRI